MTIPVFTAEQSSTHVRLEVETASCTPNCSPRAVVDNGSVFGLACLHFHLPLIFPSGSLVDGSSKVGEEQTAAVTLTKGAGGIINVDLLKRIEGAHVDGLNALQPSVFPLLEEDEEGQKEERELGLEMLQRGMEAMKSQEVKEKRGKETSSSPASTSRPRNSRVPKSAKTRTHECYCENGLDADEHINHRVAAYEIEEKRWDEGMYLDNFVDEDEEVKHLVQADLPPLSTSGTVPHNDQDSSLPVSTRKDTELLLLELLLAQAYDYRTTSGESTVESAWTIAVLCRSLVTSCLPASEHGDTIASILIGSTRRQLSFPLYRNWGLVIKVADDVVSALRQQRALAAVSRIRDLFTESEDEAIAFYSADVIAPLVQSFDIFFK
jgi:hypothetical protein